MDPLMDVIRNSEEPEWLEKPVIGELRLWQLVFLCFAGVTALIVMICCCFRFRIPRTKQQIEADYHRRRITSKFRKQLETIQDSKMDDMSLQDALELLCERKAMEAQGGSQPSSMGSQQHSSLETSFRPVAPQQASEPKPEPQQPGISFVKFANKVAILSKLTPRSPTSPTPEGNKIDFYEMT